MSAAAGEGNAVHRKGAGTPPVLLYRNVVKRFGALTAVSSASMEVRKGEVVCLIGPSGSGKSTLLRCTNGLELIDGGEIALDGELLPRDWEGMRRVRQRMGMVFQNFELFPHKTALGNVTIGPMTVLRMRRADAEQRAIDFEPDHGADELLILLERLVVHSDVVGDETCKANAENSPTLSTMSPSCPSQTMSLPRAGR